MGQKVPQFPVRNGCAQTAQHVTLMDISVYTQGLTPRTCCPCAAAQLNPGLEAQAAARIYRLGQTRPTRVIPRATSMASDGPCFQEACRVWKDMHLGISFLAASAWTKAGGFLLGLDGARHNVWMRSLHVIVLIRMCPARCSHNTPSQKLVSEYGFNGHGSAQLLKHDGWLPLYTWPLWCTKAVESAEHMCMRVFRLSGSLLLHLELLILLHRRPTRWRSKSWAVRQLFTFSLPL
eukprot:989055-Pelagomonas_calceolata.AAC.1